MEEPSSPGTSRTPIAQPPEWLYERKRTYGGMMDDTDEMELNERQSQATAITMTPQGDDDDDTDDGDPAVEVTEFGAAASATDSPRTRERRRKLLVDPHSAGFQKVESRGSSAVAQMENRASDPSAAVRLNKNIATTPFHKVRMNEQVIRHSVATGDDEEDDDFDVSPYPTKRGQSVRRSKRRHSLMRSATIKSLPVDIENAPFSSAHQSRGVQVSFNEVAPGRFVLPSERLYHDEEGVERVEALSGSVAKVLRKEYGKKSTEKVERLRIERMRASPFATTGTSLKNLMRDKSLLDVQGHAHSGMQTIGRNVEQVNRLHEQMEKEEAMQRTGCWGKLKVAAKRIARRIRGRKQKDPVPLWRASIKAVESKLGTAVASFFVFMRWVFLLNVFLSCLWFGAVILPQLASPVKQNHTTTSFDAWTLFVGEGYLEDSEMFYAGYLPTLFSGEFNMGVSYTLTIGVMFLVSFFVIVRTVSRNFGKLRDSTTLVARDSEYPFSVAVFSSWDYSLCSAKGLGHLSDSIASTLLELVEIKEAIEVKVTQKERRRLIFRRICTNILCLLIMGALAYGIYSLIEWQNANQTNTLVSIGSSLLISCISAGGPIMFTLITNKELYVKTETTVKVIMLRSWVVKMGVVLSVIISVWRQDDGTVCWVNRIGLQYYRLALADIVINTVATLWTGFGYRMINRRCCGGDRIKFDMPKNVLEVVYRQAVIWIGTSFCPILPGIGLISFTIMFFVKKHTYLRTAMLPLRYYSASRSSTFFMVTLLLSLIVVFIPVGFIVANTDTMCGAHNNIASMWQAIPDTVTTWPSWLISIMDYLFTVAFLVPLFILLCALAYYQRAILKRHKLTMADMAFALELEREDKRFLLRNVDLSKLDNQQQ